MRGADMAFLLYRASSRAYRSEATWDAGIYAKVGPKAPVSSPFGAKNLSKGQTPQWKEISTSGKLSAHSGGWQVLVPYR